MLPAGAEGDGLEEIISVFLGQIELPSPVLLTIGRGGKLDIEIGKIVRKGENSEYE